jgi:hypothetical protein
MKAIIGTMAAVAAIASTTLLATACGPGGASHSASYTAGYDAGSRGGVARNTANINVGGTMGSPYSVGTACDMAQNLASMMPKGSPGYVSDFNSADYKQGCLAAFKDHPVGS